MKKTNTIYVDLDGFKWDLDALDAAERRVLADVQKKVAAAERASGEPIQRWCDFDNSWLPKVLAFYKSRRLTRRQTMDTPVFQIAHDLSGRLAIALGLARNADYRDRLREIIDADFKSRREFCQKSGLSEDMVSHVLAGRKDLSMEALTNALDRIGYSIRFVPRNTAKNKSA